MKLSEYTTSTSIYLEQMQNYIDLAQGYNTLRKLLFQQLHQSDGSQQATEDRLADSIIANLTQNLNNHVKFHQTQKIFRTLQIIEDLITYTQEVITPFMHNQKFISALMSVALPKMVSFNPTMENQNRTRTLGIFLFWFERYAREEECPFELFISAFKHFRNKKLTFPSIITIKPNDYFKNQALKQKSQQTKTIPQISSNLIILNDICEFTAKTQLLQKQNIRSIATTEYVRLIKHKSKILYEFTAKPSQFNQQQKNTVKDLYKRLRTTLKQIDKYNQSNIQTKKMKEQQQNFIQSKNTPNKSKDSPASKNNLSGKKQTSQPSPSVKTVQDLLQNKPATVTAPVKGTSSPSPTAFNDLLDLGPSVKPPSPLNIHKKNSLAQKSTPIDADLLSDIATHPKIIEEQQFIDGITVTRSNAQPALTPKQNSATTLLQIFQNPSTPIKSNKQQEDKPLVKLDSNKSLDSEPSFQNQKKTKNPYSYIPDNLNLTPSSSANQEDQDRVKEDIGFNLFGLKKIDFQNVKEIYQSQTKYDDVPNKIKKAESLDSPKKSKIENLNLISPIQGQAPLDAAETIKKIVPADYSKFLLQQSPVSQKSESDEQNHLGLKTANSRVRKQLDQSPSQNNTLNKANDC